MKHLQALPVDSLYTPCDPEQFTFTNTTELEAIDVVIGQERALDSVHFGLRIRSNGYHVFALGPTGMGKLTAVRHIVTEQAEDQPIPPDWCYINNFQQPHKPKVLQLPAGQGVRLRQDMEQLVEELSSAIPAAFESEDYRTRIDELQQKLKEHQTEAIDALSKRAKAQHIALMHTPSGFAFAPTSTDEEVLRPDQFQKLSKAEQKRIENVVEELQRELQKILRQFPVWAKNIRDEIKDYNREIAQFAVSHLIDGLMEQYRDLPAVIAYLQVVQDDIIDNVDVFLPQPETALPMLSQAQHANQLQRYRVNVLVDNSSLNSAPVVFEDLPSHMNLVGRVEYQAQMGTLVTDFNLIKPGALHQANGGYLILDVRQVLLQPFAWDSLKRALLAREIRLDSLERTLGLTSTVSLEPEHIPLDIKVVLVGERLLYYLLSEHDPDFSDLFKVMADFEESMDRSPQSNQLYARLFATLARKAELHPLDREAVARLIEHSARLAEDAEKVSTHLRSIADVLHEANHWAEDADQQVIRRAAVQQAIDQQIYRAERVRERLYENIRRGILLIDTEGAKVGQINGLSVLQLGNFAFGQPTRITATTRLGDGKIIDIQRETELGGPIHSKGVLILSSFLASRYVPKQPLSMAASLVFEQSYGMVEGDSASLAELCALLSSLAELPIKQGLALTGSVNQHGQVQPIGGVNEKIEGFFTVCKAQGLNSEQGVLIPAANVKHLMLRHEVVQAAADGQFRVYAVETVDQALEILTQTTAGEPDEAGNFSPDSVNGRVQAKLLELSELRRSFANKETKKPEDKTDD